MAKQNGSSKKKKSKGFKKKRKMSISPTESKDMKKGRPKMHDVQSYESPVVTEFESMRSSNKIEKKSKGFEKKRKMLISLTESKTKGYYG